MTGQSGNEARWYVVQCKPQQSFRAEENLKNQGYTCLHPLVYIERIKKGKRCLLQEPLFPGYLFIHLDSQTTNWSPIRSTRGVGCLVAFNGRPMPIEDALIDEIRQRMGRTLHGEPFRAGDAVRMVSGVLTGLDGVFQSYDGEERVVILLKLMQSSKAIVLPVDAIEKA